MKVLICPDKFKGSLSAKEVCLAVSQGLQKLGRGISFVSVPLADGGEGTCELLTEWHQGKRIETEVHDPLFRPISAHYGVSGDGTMAFIEMAMASGLTLLAPEERNPLLTTTVGTGEMIADAMKRNVQKIILGIGGSATNDAGTGMATALGYQFCDADGEALAPTGENLIHMRKISTDSINPALRRTHFVTLCDVQNPLYGPDGAAYVYATQKGADAHDVQLLDAGLRNIRTIIRKYLQRTVDFPGAGAAGGLGAGTKAFLDATMERGINYMVRTTGLTEKIHHADLIITGEGKIDQQTFSGKVVSEVLRMSRGAGKPVIALCGKSDLSASEALAQGFTRIVSLIDENTSHETAIQKAATLIPDKIYTAVKEITLT